MRAAVGLGELDTIAFDLIDGAEMDAVGADHFHMFFDVREVGHAGSPFTYAINEARRAAFQR